MQAVGRGAAYVGTTKDGIELDVGSGAHARHVGEEFHEAVTLGSSARIGNVMKLSMGCAKAIFDGRIPMTATRNVLFDASEISAAAQ